MQELKNALKSGPIVFVTRDIERALGLPLATMGYWIITNSSPLANELRRKYFNILIIAAEKMLDTHELLRHPETIKFIENIIARPLPTLPLLEGEGAIAAPPPNEEGVRGRFRFVAVNILVFKNTTQIEKICSEHGWQLLNPSAELANRVEQKLTQLEWLGPLKKYLPEHRVLKCKDLVWDSETSLPILSSAEARRNRRHLSLAKERQGEVSRFIVQFNHAHTGLGTILIESQKQIDELKNKFPDREVRVVKFVSGPVFTNNNVVWGKKVLCGNINFQITGLTPFTDRPFATIGNDWALPNKVLGAKQTKQYKQIATDVGQRLMGDGWKGLFGIDVIMDEKTGKLYLLEINARQPASTTFESQLQRSVIPTEPKGERRNPLTVATRGSSDFSTTARAFARNDKRVTTFEVHLAALMGLQTTNYGLQKISDGAQIIQRVLDASVRRSDRSIKMAVAELRKSNFNVIQYTNKNPGEDLLRIQSKKGIMKNLNEFNEVGKKILLCYLPKPNKLSTAI